MKNIAFSILSIILSIGYCFVAAIISFGLGYLIGWVLVWLFGNVIVSGLADAGITVAVEAIPVFCAIISYIAILIKPSSNTGANKNTNPF